MASANLSRSHQKGSTPSPKAAYTKHNGHRSLDRGPAGQTMKLLDHPVLVRSGLVTLAATCRNARSLFVFFLFCLFIISFVSSCLCCDPVILSSEGVALRAAFKSLVIFCSVDYQTNNKTPIAAGRPTEIYTWFWRILPYGVENAFMMIKFLPAISTGLSYPPTNLQETPANATETQKAKQRVAWERREHVVWPPSLHLRRTFIHPQS